MGKGRLGWLALLALVAALAIGCGSSTGTSDTGNGSSGGQQTAQPAAKKWVKVITFKGGEVAGDFVKSRAFTLKGRETKLTYKLRGDPSVVFFTVYVEDSDYMFATGGGIPVLMATTMKGTSKFDRKAGPHVMFVSAANCRWSVTIFEKR